MRMYAVYGWDDPDDYLGLVGPASSKESALEMARFRWPGLVRYVTLAY